MLMTYYDYATLIALDLHPWAGSFETRCYGARHRRQAALAQACPLQETHPKYAWLVEKLRSLLGR